MKNEKAVKFVDINGETIGYVPNDELKYIYRNFGDNFEPQPFIGKCIQHPNKSYIVLYGITYSELSDNKKGVMRTLKEHIIDFQLKYIDYYNGLRY